MMDFEDREITLSFYQRAILRSLITHEKSKIEFELQCARFVNTEATDYLRKRLDNLNQIYNNIK